MKKAELVIVRGNQEQDWLCLGEVKSLDFLPNYMSRSPQGVEVGICAIYCEQIVLLQSSCVILDL